MPNTQGVDRLAMSDRVYLAVGQWPHRLRNVKKLCRRLGLGLIVVTAGRADIALDPVPYRPRRDRRKTGRLLGEHARRVGDPNRGGSTARVPMMTAYRQEALRCAELLAGNGPMRLAAMRAAADVPNAARIVRHDYYGWFERIERGVYALSPAGQRDLTKFAPVPGCADPAQAEGITQS